MFNVNWFYLSTIAVVALMMLGMTFHVLTYRGFNKKQKRWFTWTFLSIVFCCFSEFAVHCGYYNPDFKVPLIILTMLQFSLSPVLAVFFCGALGLRGQKVVAIVFFALGLVAETVCIFNGWIFSFNETGYLRGDYFFAYEIFFSVSFAYLLVCLFIVGRRFKNRDLVTIGMVFVIVAAGIAILIFFEQHVTYIAIGLCACLSYIYYNDLVQQDMKAELVDKQEKMSRMQNHIITALASLIESRDANTGEHVIRTSYFAKNLAEEIKGMKSYSKEVTDEFVQLIYLLAPLHDVGKIVVSDQILTKPARLTPEEFEEMKKHASMGGVVIKQILEGVADEDYLNFASDIAMYHHERWDGTGYPTGLKGKKIPLAARIMAIADVFDALTAERCYKPKMEPEKAFQIIEEEAGTHFDPQLVKVFLKNKEQYVNYLAAQEATDAKKEDIVQS